MAENVKCKFGKRLSRYYLLITARNVWTEAMLLSFQVICFRYCKRVADCSVFSSLQHSYGSGEPKVEYFQILELVRAECVRQRSALRWPLFWSERSACANLGCWHKRRWPPQMAFFSLSFFLPAHC